MSEHGSKIYEVTAFWYWIGVISFGLTMLNAVGTVLGWIVGAST